MFVFLYHIPLSCIDSWIISCYIGLAFYYNRLGIIDSSRGGSVKAKRMADIVTKREGILFVVNF